MALDSAARMAARMAAFDTFPVQIRNILNEHSASHDVIMQVHLLLQRGVPPDLVAKQLQYALTKLLVPGGDLK